MSIKSTFGDLNFYTNRLCDFYKEDFAKLFFDQYIEKDIYFGDSPAEEINKKLKYWKTEELIDFENALQSTALVSNYSMRAYCFSQLNESRKRLTFYFDSVKEKFDEWNKTRNEKFDCLRLDDYKDFLNDRNKEFLEVIDRTLPMFEAEKNQMKSNEKPERTEKEYQTLQVIKHPEILEILYNGMTGRFISKMGKDVFSNHFLTNNPNLLPINQIGKRYDFIFLFDCLTKYLHPEVLDSKKDNDRCDKWLSEHCTFKDKRLPAKQISTARAKKTGQQPSSLLTINDIISKVEKLVKE